MHFIIFINNYYNIIELSNATPTKPITIARPTAYYVTDDNSYYSAYSPATTPATNIWTASYILQISAHGLGIS